MIHFTMNMPFSLMVFYGSIMIIVVLILRALLKNHLPKFVFPIFWGIILLRLLIPFSLSSPLSMKVPDFFRNPFYEEVTAVDIVENLRGGNTVTAVDIVENLPTTAKIQETTPHKPPKTTVCYRPWQTG